MARLAITLTNDRPFALPRNVINMLRQRYQRDSQLLLASHQVRHRRVLSRSLRQPNIERSIIRHRRRRVVLHHSLLTSLPTGLPTSIRRRAARWDTIRRVRQALNFILSGNFSPHFINTHRTLLNRTSAPLHLSRLQNFTIILSRHHTRTFITLSRYIRATLRHNFIRYTTRTRNNQGIVNNTIQVRFPRRPLPLLNGQRYRQLFTQGPISSQ